MLIKCPKCKKQYNVDGSKITDRGVKITCPSCKHQFIARKRSDETAKAAPQPEKQQKKEAPKRKSPPCEVCGEPSTHVFKGPPPRPLCEFHYKVETEKSSRFFQQAEPEPEFLQETPSSDPGTTEPAAKYDPGATKAAPQPPAKETQPDPDQTKPPVQDKDESTLPSNVSEPSFESFDDEFEFFDSDRTPPPKQKEPPAPTPPAPEPPPEQEGKAEPEDSGQADFVMDDHEFMQPGAGLVEAHEQAGDEAAPDTTGDELETTIPPAGEQTLETEQTPGPEKTQAQEPGQPPEPAWEDFGDEGSFQEEVPKENIEQAPEPDPFKPEPADVNPEQHPTPPEQESYEFKAEQSPDPFAADGISTDDSGPADMRGQGMPGEDGFNLDGSPAQQYQPAREEPEDTFEWESPSQERTGDGLDAETGVGPEPAPAKEPAPPKVPKKQPAPSGPRPLNPRGMVSAMLALAVLLTAFAASAYLSLFGVPDMGPTEEHAEFKVPAWEGRLTMGSDEGASARSVQPLPQLPGDAVPEKAEIVAEAQHKAGRAEKLMLEDKKASHEKAEGLIEQAIKLDPENPAFHALRINILAFADSVGAQGSMQASNRAEASLAHLGEGLKSAPAMLRAKAHVFLAGNKTAAARSLLDQYLDQYPRDGIALYLKGLTYLYQPGPDYEKAVSYIEEALNYEPGMVRAHWDLAGAYRKIGRYEDAIDAYNQVLMRSPDRQGTAEAMEDTLREQSRGASADSRDPGNRGETTIIPIPKKEGPKGLAATGSDISDNVLRVINHVYPEISKLEFSKEPEAPRVFERERPRPPEEAPE